MKKIKQVVLLAAALSMVTSMTSLAGAVNSVAVSVVVDKNSAEAGIPYRADIEVSRGSRYEITDYSWSKDYERWEAGSKVTARISLEIKDEYKEDYSFKNISASCSGGEVVSKSSSDDTATVKISYIPKMKLEPPENVGWDSENAGMAKWKRVKGASKYYVEVMVDGTRKDRITATENSCDLTSYLVRYIDNDVSFRVQAAGGAYTDSSEFQPCEGTYDYGDTSVYGTVKTSDSGATTARDEEGKPITGWNQILGKWYYFNDRGTALTGWQQLSGTWYCFNENGMMLTGWQKINGTWYFLRNSGDMMTGWMQEGPNGTWYYMNESGAMVTGWNAIGGMWYYFDSSGRMLSDCVTPDGYTVDHSGKWIH